MNWIIIACVTLIVLIPLLLAALLRNRERTGTTVYRQIPALFSPEERVLFSVLREAVGDEFEIFGRIRVGDIIQASRGTQAGRTGFEQVAAQCFHFVLCSKRDLSVVCALQIQDSRRHPRRSPDRDGALPALCEEAGLPLVPVVASPLLEAAQLRAAIMSALQHPPLSLPHGDGRKEPRISSIDGLELD